MPLILLLVAVVVAVVVVVVVKKKGSAEPDHQFIDVSERLAAPRAAATPDAATAPVASSDDRAAATPAAPLAAAPDVDAEPDDAEPDLSRFGVVPAERPRVEIPWPTNAPAVPAHPMEGPLPTLDLSDPRPGDGGTGEGPDAAEAAPSTPVTTGPAPDATVASDAEPGAGEPEASVDADGEVAARAEATAVEDGETGTEQQAGDDSQVGTEQRTDAEQTVDEPPAVPSMADEADEAGGADESALDEPTVAEVAVDALVVDDVSVGDLSVGDVTVVDDVAEAEAETVVASEPEADPDEGPTGGEAEATEVTVDAGLAAETDDGTGTAVDDDAVIDLVAREAVGREPAPEEDPVDMVLNALISRARERHVGVAEVAAELVEQAEIEDREVDEVLAELVGWSEDGDDAVRTADRLSELTLFNDAVPTRPGELSQFERLASTEKKRVIIRVLCLLVAQSGDRVKPREPRSEAETRGWPLARAVWPVPVEPEAAEPEGELPARPVVRSVR